MENIEVTTMTSRGQIVIPQAIREALSLDSGAKFVVVGEGDTVILKRLEMPSSEGLKGLLTQSRQLAKKKGLKKSSVNKVIVAVRGKR